jgi:chemotaxis protein MotB
MGKKACVCAEGTPAWMVTFSDLMSLLLVFFVLIVSMSATNPEPLSKAAGSLRGSMGILKETAAVMEKSVVVVPKISDVDVGELSYAISKLQDFVESQSQGQSIKVAITSTGIAVRILTPLLFDRGSVELRPEGMPYLAKVLDIAKGWENTIRVAGHTDDQPVNNPLFKSNWELSYARAMSVINFGIQYSKLNPAKFSAVGYGEYRPAFPNDSEENRRNNRRVEVFIEYAVNPDPLHPTTGN